MTKDSLSIPIIRHRILLSDPLGRWSAPLKAALPQSCEWVIWPEAASRTTSPVAPGDSFAHWLLNSGPSLSLGIWHCHLQNLQFAKSWFTAGRDGSLPPLVALLDQPDPAAAQPLREIGCVEVHAGFHSWARLVKTVTAILQTPVISDRSLEDQIAANLPWAP